MHCMTAESVEAKEWEKLEYFEGLFAAGGTGAARAGHAAVWADEAGGTERSADGENAVGGGAAAGGESAGRFV